MEKQFKRLFCALFALGFSASAFADSQVVVPSQEGGFKIGIDALYLRALNSDLDYAVTTVLSDIPVTSMNQTNASVEPGYAWGYYVQVGYLVPCTGNDITLGYTYLRTDDTNAVVRPNISTPDSFGVVLVPPMSNLISLIDTGEFNAANAKAKFDLNVADLEFGQRFTAGTYDLRMFAGLRYARIDHTLSVNALEELDGDGNPLPTNNGAQEYTSDYRGFGPRVGMDARYCLQSGFGLDANLSTSLLVGNIDSKYNLNVVQSITPTNVTFEESNGTNTRIVPVLEAKLGVDYTYILDYCEKSTVVFELGYQATNYFNAKDRVSVVDPIAGPTSNFLTKTTDVSFDGIYFGVRYYS
jgi:hypothetical protein